MDIKLVIFDFDGTLADTRKAIILAKQEAMKEMGFEVLDEEACASTIGLSAKTGFEKLYPDLPEDKMDMLVSAYRRSFEIKKEIVPPVTFPNVEKVLSALQSKGLTLTIATSRNSPSLKELLEKLELSGYFGYTLGGNDTVLLKPDPEPVLKTLKDLSFNAENTIVVGDMPYDVKMGKDAGTYVCGVTYGNASKESLIESGADFIIDDIEELLDIVDI